MSPGEMIKDARTRRGLSQSDVARAVGVSRVSVSFWESGRRAPGSDKLHALFDALEMTAAERNEYIRAVSDRGQL